MLTTWGLLRADRLLPNERGEKKTFFQGFLHKNQYHISPFITGCHLTSERKNGNIRQTRTVAFFYQPTLENQSRKAERNNSFISADYSNVYDKMSQCNWGYATDNGKGNTRFCGEGGINFDCDHSFFHHYNVCRKLPNFSHDHNPLRNVYSAPYYET